LGAEVEASTVDEHLDTDERRALRIKARAATLESLRTLGGMAGREAVRRRARADGGFTPRELAAAAPPSAAGRYADLLDHQLSWALTALKRDGLVQNPARGIWALAGAALETPEPAVHASATAARLRELQLMPYRDYLRTREWRQTRAAALMRASHCCSLDVTHTEDLEVHHRTYERLGRELAGDLVVLCRKCHRLHHSECGRPRRSASTPSPPVAWPTTTARTPPDESKRSLLDRLLGRYTDR
jgi:restriction endonuclease Mrr